jgi:hypothetical protein
MNLHEYLATSGALTVAQLRAAIGAPSDAQVRQWQHAYAERKPNPIYCVAIERATAGRCTVEELNATERWIRVPDPEWPHPKGRPVIDPASALSEVPAPTPTPEPAKEA